MKTLAEFKKVYTGHFFDRSTMKFFKSRIESNLIKGRYFITSESDMRGTERFYNIREISQLSSGEWTINTVSDFNSLRSLSSAKHRLNGLSIINNILGE